MFRPLTSVIALTALGLAAPQSAAIAEPTPHVLTIRRSHRQRFGGAGPGVQSRIHGYRPHPAAFRRRRKRAPYKGNLGPRH